MIKPWFQGKGETFRKDRGFEISEKLGGEVNDQMVGIGINVGKGGEGGLKLGEEGNWNVRACEKPENRGKEGTVVKRDGGRGVWGTQVS